MAGRKKTWELFGPEQQPKNRAPSGSDKTAAKALQQAANQAAQAAATAASAAKSLVKTGASGYNEKEKSSTSPPASSYQQTERPGAAAKGSGFAKSSSTAGTTGTGVVQRPRQPQENQLHAFSPTASKTVPGKQAAKAQGQRASDTAFASLFQHGGMFEDEEPFEGFYTPEEQRSLIEQWRRNQESEGLQLPRSLFERGGVFEGEEPFEGFFSPEEKRSLIEDWNRQQNRRNPPGSLFQKGDAPDGGSPDSSGGNAVQDFFTWLAQMGQGGAVATTSTTSGVVPTAQPTAAEPNNPYGLPDTVWEELQKEYRDSLAGDYYCLDIQTGQWVYEPEDWSHILIVRPGSELANLLLKDNPYSAMTAEEKAEWIKNDMSSSDAPLADYRLLLIKLRYGYPLTQAEYQRALQLQKNYVNLTRYRYQPGEDYNRFLLARLNPDVYDKIDAFMRLTNPLAGVSRTMDAAGNLLTKFGQETQQQAWERLAEMERQLAENPDLMDDETFYHKYLMVKSQTRDALIDWSQFDPTARSPATMLFDEAEERARQILYPGLEGAGKLAVDAGVAGTNLLWDFTLGAMSGINPLVIIGMRQAGNATQKALDEGYSATQAGVFGAISGGATIFIESLGGIGGSHVVGKMMGTALGQQVLSKVPARAMEFIVNASSSKLGQWLGGAIVEGTEEVIEYDVQRILENIILDKDTPRDVKEQLYGGLIGAIVGGVYGGGKLLTQGNPQPLLDLPDLDARRRRLLSLPPPGSDQGILLLPPPGGDGPLLLPPGDNPLLVPQGPDTNLPPLEGGGNIKINPWGNIENLTNVATTPGKGGVTPVGRAFQKHAGNSNRAGTFSGEVSGNAAQNTLQGVQYLERILTNPNASFMVRYTKAFGDVLDVRLPDGTGARWSADGTKFIGFLEKYTNGRS